MAGSIGRQLWKQLSAIAEEEVRHLLSRLPPALREKADALPIAFEPRPSRRVVEEDGIEPDTMGLFLGEAFPDEYHGGGDIPAQIVLYLENILDEAEGNEDVYREELRTTLLHELGHYLGLDEGEIELRDLQ